MSTELQRTPTQSANGLTVWHKTEEIRKMFAPNLSESEFSLFIGLGQNLGANPFLREIWAVKYGDQAASIFLGRDFYRRKAQEQADYDGHAVDAIYSNDGFKVVTGIPQHEYNLKSRGVLLGAYCVVYKKGQKQPYFVFADLKEYYKGHKNEDGTIKKNKYGDMKPTNWDTMPATMIKKVAEAQGLRGAYQGVFAGTYDESEQWTEKTEDVKAEVVPQIPQADQIQINTILELCKSEFIYDKEKKMIMQNVNTYNSNKADVVINTLRDYIAERTPKTSDLVYDEDLENKEEETGEAATDKQKELLWRFMQSSVIKGHERESMKNDLPIMTKQVASSLIEYWKEEIEKRKAKPVAA